MFLSAHMLLLDCSSCSNVCVCVCIALLFNLLFVCGGGSNQCRCCFCIFPNMIFSMNFNWKKKKFFFFSLMNCHSARICFLYNYCHVSYWYCYYDTIYSHNNNNSNTVNNNNQSKSWVKKKSILMKLIHDTLTAWVYFEFYMFI